MRSFRFAGATLTLALLSASRAVAQGDGRPTQPPPLRLSDVLARAVAQHPLVEAARARVAGARGARLTARSLSNPILTYQVENAGFPGRTAPPGIDREVSTLVSLPLEPLFQRWARVRRAQEDVRAAEAELELARRTVALDAAQAFYRVALAQAAVEGGVDVRDRLAELAGYTRARVKEGITSEGDLIRVEVELDRAEASLALERVELARARGELLPYLGDVAAGARLDSVLVVVDTTAGVTAPSAGGAVVALAPLDAYLARARASRPDLVATRARVAAASAEAGYQRTLAVRQVAAAFGSKRIGSVNTMTAGLSVPLPLFDQNRGEVQRATAERSAVEQELTWRERQVASQVAAAHQAVRLLAEQHGRLSGAAMDRAEEARRIALAAYREGAATLLQVIDASRTLADVRLAYYRTLFAERASLLELNVVSGSELLAASSAPTSSPDNATGQVPAPNGARP